MSSRSWFSRSVLASYDQGHRDLPWRRTRDPYRIWLSEVILQQTRVDQGLAYYERFVARYPTVKRLASAKEDEVLKLWQGLGYYSRARNLLQAAQQVVKEHGGHFPSTHTGLLGLKGVGDYTAAAIASIAFAEAVPVVDGNVYRALSRVFGISTPIDSTAGKKQFRTLAASLVDADRPGDHNQAVMELGATICTPRKPRCTECPVRSRCVALKEGRIEQLPVKAKKQTVRVRHFNYLWIENRSSVLFTRREGRDIWQGLHELPLVETTRNASKLLLKKTLGEDMVLKKMEGPLEHVLSHQRIMATLWKVEVPTGVPAKWAKEWKPVKRGDIGGLAIHRLMEKLLEAVD